MPEDAAYWIKLIDCGPNKYPVARCIRKYACWLSLREVKQAVEDPPKLIFIEAGYMTMKEAERKVRPILDELEALGATADWEFYYGDIE